MISCGDILTFDSIPSRSDAVCPSSDGRFAIVTRQTIRVINMAVTRSAGQEGSVLLTNIAFPEINPESDISKYYELNVKPFCLSKDDFFAQAVWSPLGCSSSNGGGCLLTVLTRQHRVFLYSLDSIYDSYNMIFDIGTVIIDYLKRERVSQSQWHEYLCVSTMSWSQCLDSPLSISFLALGTQSGYLIVLGYRDFTFCVLKVQSITQTCWITGLEFCLDDPNQTLYLTVASDDGSVSAFHVEVGVDTSAISLSKIVDLCGDDGRPVHIIKNLAIPNGFRFYFVKCSAVEVYEMHRDENGYSVALDGKCYLVDTNISALVIPNADQIIAFGACGQIKAFLRSETTGWVEDQSRTKSIRDCIVEKHSDQKDDEEEPSPLSVETETLLDQNAMNDRNALMLISKNKIPLYKGAAISANGLFLSCFFAEKTHMSNEYKPPAQIRSYFVNYYLGPREVSLEKLRPAMKRCSTSSLLWDVIVSKINMDAASVSHYKEFDYHINWDDDSIDYRMHLDRFQKLSTGQGPDVPFDLVRLAKCLRKSNYADEQTKIDCAMVLGECVWTDKCYVCGEDLDYDSFRVTACSKGHRFPRCSETYQPLFKSRMILKCGCGRVRYDAAPKSDIGKLKHCPDAAALFSANCAPLIERCSYCNDLMYHIV